LSGRRNDDLKRRRFGVAVFSSGASRAGGRAAVLQGHDPEKWELVFGKDHAQAIIWSAMTNRRTVITLECGMAFLRIATQL
jgi:hypothetical protein